MSFSNWAWKPLVVAIIINSLHDNGLDPEAPKHFAELLQNDRFSSLNFFLSFFLFKCGFPFGGFFCAGKKLDNIALWTTESRYSSRNRKKEATCGVPASHNSRSLCLCKSGPCKLHTAARTTELVYIFWQAHQGRTVRLSTFDKSMGSVTPWAHWTSDLAADLDHCTTPSTL